MGLKLQPFTPMLDVKMFVMPFGTCTLSWTLLYIFSRRAINLSVTPYEYNNLSNNLPSKYYHRPS